MSQDIKMKEGQTQQRKSKNRKSTNKAETEFFDKLVAVNRVTKVVKGGRRFSFVALVVVGDKKGRVGFGHGKAREVPEAVMKATNDAKKSLIRVPLREARTLHHDVRGKFGSGKVMLRVAPPGTGIISGGAMRSVFEMLGVHDVVSKSFGSSNPHNLVKATIKALSQCRSPREIAFLRDKKIGDIISNRSIFKIGKK